MRKFPLTATTFKAVWNSTSKEALRKKETKVKKHNANSATGSTLQRCRFFCVCAQGMFISAHVIKWRKIAVRSCGPIIFLSRKINEPTGI